MYSKYGHHLVPDTYRTSYVLVEKSLLPRLKPLVIFSKIQKKLFQSAVVLFTAIATLSETLVFPQDYDYEYAGEEESTTTTTTTTTTIATTTAPYSCVNHTTTSKKKNLTDNPETSQLIGKTKTDNESKNIHMEELEESCPCVLWACF